MKFLIITLRTSNILPISIKNPAVPNRRVSSMTTCYLKTTARQNPPREANRPSKTKLKNLPPSEIAEEAHSSGTTPKKELLFRLGPGSPTREASNWYSSMRQKATTSKAIRLCLPTMWFGLQWRPSKLKKLWKNPNSDLNVRSNQSKLMKLSQCKGLISSWPFPSAKLRVFQSTPQLNLDPSKKCLKILENCWH